MVPKGSQNETPKRANRETILYTNLELGFDHINGARPMAKVIQEKIKIPISEIILKSKKISGVIQVDYSEVNDTFVVEVNEKISVKQTTP